MRIDIICPTCSAEFTTEKLPCTCPECSRRCGDPLAQAYIDRDGTDEAEANTLAAAVRGVLAG